MERYTLAVYTAAARGNLERDAGPDWQVAGLGVSRAYPGFDALELVPAELEGIVRHGPEDRDGVVPGRVLLDDAFDAEALKDTLRQRFPVLHIASHFRLNPGDAGASFLLLGDGSTLTLEEFRRGRAYKLRDLDLLTLAACDTAVGEDGDGKDVESFGALAQARGAAGVLATLWAVADASTAELMQTLYRLRGEDPAMTKAEALRQAQLAPLRGAAPVPTDDIAAGNAEDPETKTSGAAGEDIGTARGLDQVSPAAVDGEAGKPSAASVVDDRSHPFYRAPFILMGNWL